LEEKRGSELVQVSVRETNESKPFEDVSLRILSVVKTRGVVFSWEESVGCLMTGQTAAGIERA
jgi:hypothetical protein